MDEQTVTFSADHSGDFSYIKINDVPSVSSPSFFSPLFHLLSRFLFPSVFLWDDAHRTICARKPNASRHYANFFHRSSEIFAQSNGSLREDALATTIPTLSHLLLFYNYTGTPVCRDVYSCTIMPSFSILNVTLKSEFFFFAMGLNATNKCNLF